MRCASRRTHVCLYVNVSEIKFQMPNSRFAWTRHPEANEHPTVENSLCFHFQFNEFRNRRWQKQNALVAWHVSSAENFSHAKAHTKQQIHGRIVNKPLKCTRCRRIDFFLHTTSTITCAIIFIHLIHMCVCPAFCRWVALMRIAHKCKCKKHVDGRREHLRHVLLI